MKKLFLVLAAVVALAACSKEEILTVSQPEAIDFGAPFVENSTRAAVDPSYNGTAEFTQFQVWHSFQRRRLSQQRFILI